MKLAEIFKIFIFLFGTALQIALLVLMARRVANSYRERVFALFTFSVLGWTLCVFFSLFCKDLYRGSNVMDEMLTPMACVFYVASISLFTHCLVDFSSKKLSQTFNWKKIFLIILLYQPIIISFSSILAIIQERNSILVTLAQLNDLYLPWMIILFAFSWFIVIDLCQKVQDEDEVHFLGNVGWMITVVMWILFVVFIIQKSIYTSDSYLVLIVEIICFLLPAILAYYLYCYNYIEYVFKRGLTYVFLGIFISMSYYHLIRPLGENMEKRLQINFRMVEGILVMALVVFFDPLKRFLQKLSNRVFFREQQYYRKVFSDISGEINRAAHMELEEILEYVAVTVSRAMKIREVAFIFFSKKEGDWNLDASTLQVDLHEISHLIDYLDKRDLPVLNIYDLGEEEFEVLVEMRKIRAFTIISIYSENQRIGILCVGKRRLRHQLIAEEEDLLMMLVNQMITAIENTRLLRENFMMERRMFKNDKLTSLGRLSTSIAHEVKNPLSSIKAITQVMKEDLPEDDAHQEGLSLVIEEIDRLSRVVKQLLLFARPNETKLGKVNVKKILQHVILLLRHPAQVKKINIIDQVEGEIISLFSDSDILTEVLFNLIHNSIQALHEGGTVKIAGNIRFIEKHHQECLVLQISDNGPGIPEDSLEKIFEPFYTTKQTGTGLGLSIVKKHLQKLHGFIEVKNHQQGACFEITLPCRESGLTI